MKPNTLQSLFSNLQQRTSLASGVWTTPPEPILDNGTTKSISVDTSGGNRFFRLSD